VTTEPLTRVDPVDFARRAKEISELEAATRARTGHESLGESAWRDLGNPAPGSVGFFAGDDAYVHVARAENGEPSSWTASLVKDSALPADAFRPLLAAAVEHVAEHGGATLACWIFGVSSADDTVFADLGFHPRGTLFEMRAPFPIAGTPSWPEGVSVRAFEPGRDDAEWLAVNNRAFLGHPDQGDWHASTLHDRMAEDWFDPSLFLLAVDDAGIAGYNWLKWHAAEAPDSVLGEIYAIGVDPRAQGTGLGRALAIAGLHAIHERGADTGMLFVAADNTGALALYRSLGFDVHRTDRAYVREIGTT
jgi:mycothiol synthase